MSDECLNNRKALRQNFFSSPDFTHNGLPTGGERENNVQTIKDNMVSTVVTDTPTARTVLGFVVCFVYGTP